MCLKAGCGLGCRATTTKSRCGDTSIGFTVGEIIIHSLVLFVLCAFRMFEFLVEELLLEVGKETAFPMKELPCDSFTIRNAGLRGTQEENSSHLHQVSIFSIAVLETIFGHFVGKATKS